MALRQALQRQREQIELTAHRQTDGACCIGHRCHRSRAEAGRAVHGVDALAVDQGRTELACDKAHAGQLSLQLCQLWRSFARISNDDFGAGAHAPASHRQTGSAQTQHQHALVEQMLLLPLGPEHGHRRQLGRGLSLGHFDGGNFAARRIRNTGVGKNLGHKSGGILGCRQGGHIGDRRHGRSGLSDRLRRWYRFSFFHCLYCISISNNFSVCACIGSDIAHRLCKHHRIQLSRGRHLLIRILRIVVSSFHSRHSRSHRRHGILGQRCLGFEVFGMHGVTSASKWTGRSGTAAW